MKFRSFGDNTSSRVEDKLKIKDTVLEGLEERKLEDESWLDTLAIVFSMCVMLLEKSKAKNDKRS